MPFSLKRSGINGALVLVGLALSVGFGHALTERKPRAPSELERRTLAARATCQVLFLGPSYVASQILPDAFDDEARRVGLDARACKFGRRGLRGYELRQQFQSFMQRRWPKLELVIYDITMGQHIGFESANWFKARMLDWHTLDSIPWLTDYYRCDPRGWPQKLPEAWSHLEHVAAHYLLLGHGTELVFKPVTADDDEADAGDDDEDSDGAAVNPAAPVAGEVEQAPESRRLPKKVRRLMKRRARRAEERQNQKAAWLAERQADELGHRRRLHNLERYRRELARHPAYDPSTWPLELRALTRSYGLDAYFLYAPVWYPTRPPDRTAKGEDRLVLLDFADPTRYPELYRPEARGRTQHLGPIGYEIYSRLLARELAQHWHPRALPSD